MTERAEALFRFLDREGLPHHTVRHRPVFHVQDGEDIKAGIAGGHSKNLFLKDAKDRLWLVTAEERAVIDLKSLPRRIGSARLSFGSPARLTETLGVTPGSVTPLALINDLSRSVTLVLDKALLEHEVVNFHPLTNEATTSLARSDFLRFLDVLGYHPQVVDFRSGSDCEGGVSGPF
jgi:Ala-tRNA(Pro) deacylase